MTEISPKKAFVHLVYEYRCLVRAEYLFKMSPTIDNGLVKESGTTARNASLSKARSIIDFYTKKIGENNTRETDITLYDYFKVDFDSLRHTLTITDLENIKKAIEVHDLHLTAYRDELYRYKLLQLDADLPQNWKDWDEIESKIVNELVSLLERTSSLLNEWRIPFIELHKISNKILLDGGDWEGNLNGPVNIEKYLKSLGL